MKASGVPRLSAKGLRTGFLDIVELKIANIPMVHTTKKKDFNNLISLNLPSNHIKDIYTLKVNNRIAIPPKIMANPISNTVIDKAFFNPNSLINTAIVEIQGI